MGSLFFTEKTCITYCMPFKIWAAIANSKTKIVDNRNSPQNYSKDIEQAEFEIFKEPRLEGFPDEFRILEKDIQ